MVPEPSAARWPGFPGQSPASPPLAMWACISAAQSSQGITGLSRKLTLLSSCNLSPWAVFLQLRCLGVVGNNVGVSKVGKNLSFVANVQIGWMLYPARNWRSWISGCFSSFSLVCSECRELWYTMHLFSKQHRKILHAYNKIKSVPYLLCSQKM